MKTTQKALVLVLCAALLVAASVMGTLAYLTDSDEVTNTFTVGNVHIDLDEAVVSTDGTVQKDASGKELRTSDPDTGTEGNAYHLLPGHSYTKDPMVTVKKTSEDCYVRMFVTISNSKEWDALFVKYPGLDLTQILDLNTTAWTLYGNVEDEAANTRTYEFRYASKVTDVSDDADKELEKLFTKITTPSVFTNEDLATLEGFTINIVAHAIQADGFETAEAAWAKW